MQSKHEQGRFKEVNLTMGGYLQGIVVNRMAFPFLTLFFIQCNTNNPTLQHTFNANYHAHNLIGKFTIHTDDKCRDFTNLFAMEYSKYSIKRPPDNFAELTDIQESLGRSFAAASAQKFTSKLQRNYSRPTAQTLSIMSMRLLNSFQA